MGSSITMAKNTPEFEAIRQNFDKIAPSLQSDLTGISSRLISVGLINQDQGRAARSTSTAPSIRAADLLDVVLTMIQLDSHNYYKFVDLLRESGETYKYIVKKLDNTIGLAKPMEKPVQFQQGIIIMQVISSKYSKCSVKTSINDQKYPLSAINDVIAQ